MPGEPGPTGPKGETGSQGEKGEASSAVGRALFSAYRSSGGHFDGIVTFDVVDIDKENQLDKESGVFKCKVPGVYLFSFSGEATRVFWAPGSWGKMCTAYKIRQNVTYPCRNNMV